MMSLVGIATLGPSIMPPKQPGDAVAYITAAIPFFVLQMAVEQLVIKVRLGGAFWTPRRPHKSRTPFRTHSHQHARGDRTLCIGYSSLPPPPPPLPLLSRPLSLLFVRVAPPQAAGIAEHSPASAYDLADSWSASNSGIMQQLFMKIVLKPIAGGGMYIWVYNSTAGLPFLPRPAMESWAACIALFVCVDFAYYWLHRSAHVSAVLWLGHSVHHDSEHYNNSTALRQGTATSTSFLTRVPRIRSSPRCARRVVCSARCPWSFGC